MPPSLAKRSLVISESLTISVLKIGQARKRSHLFPSRVVGVHLAGMMAQVLLINYTGWISWIRENSILYINRVKRQDIVLGVSRVETSCSTANIHRNPRKIRTLTNAAWSHLRHCVATDTGGTGVTSTSLHTSSSYDVIDGKIWTFRAT